LRSVHRCYKQDISRAQLIVGQSSFSEELNTEAEGLTALEAVTRQQLVKAQQTEKY
jgi:hypothetical protein